MRAALLASLLVAATLAGPASPAARAQAPFEPPETAGISSPTAQDEQVLRIFEIRYRSVSEVTVLVSPLVSPGALLEMNAATRTVTVRDRPDVVRQVEAFLRQFDVPPHAVVVRIVVERAERVIPASGDVVTDAAGWSFARLADTTLEVLERGHVTQVFGPDETLEIHVRLDSVDAERHLMNFDEFRLARRAPANDDASPPPARELLSTGLELQDRVGKVVMAARTADADEGLIVRVIGLIRDRTAVER